MQASNVRTGRQAYHDQEEDFWKQVKRKIEDAKPGNKVIARAGGYDRMPVYVMEALLEHDEITQEIHWNGGDRITIPAGKALIPEAGRIYYPLSYLEGIDFGALAANIERFNPNTGGVLEVNAPAISNNIVTPDGKPEITDPRRGTAATIEDAEKGIEKAIPGVFEPVTEAPALDVVTEQQSKSGGLFAGIAVLPAALAAGGGSWVVWKKRKTAKR